MLISFPEVHLWQIRLDRAESDISILRTCLSTDEIQRADRFVRPIDRQRFTVARASLRLLLSQYLQMPPTAIQFQYGDRGKPKVSHLLPHGGELQFNLSHSANLALYAVACDRRVGVDLEQLRPMEDAAQLVQRFFTAGEYQEFCQISLLDRPTAFFRGWTAKEAYLKATGQGVAHLSDVEFSLTPPTRLLKILTGTESIENWSVTSLDLEHPFVGAIAIEGQAWNLKIQNGQPFDIR